MSKRGESWCIFAEKVKSHIDDYTIAQYGDTGDDLASSFTPEQCIQQVRKYMARFGKNRRIGQDKLDMLKAVHYLQMAHDLLEKNNDSQKTSFESN